MLIMMAKPKAEQMLRASLEAKIEEMIALLDAIDGDENLEDGNDAEPSLDSAPQLVGKRLEYDLELDSADDEFTGDEHEPTLGWRNPRCGELDYAAGWEASDLSDERMHAGEPSLAYNGCGYSEGRQLLRGKLNDTQKLAKALDATRAARAYRRHL
jgi:hypothetical protein